MANRISSAVFGRATAALVCVLPCIVACGGHDAPAAKSPEASSAAASSGTTAATARAGAKGTFHAFARSASSGKVDKVSSKDGAFAPDGQVDAIFDVDYEGAATAFFIVSTDAQGMPDGIFHVDTLVGDQEYPTGLEGTLNEGKFTPGLAVFEGDKLLNAKDGTLAPLGEGRHKLTLYVSSKDAATGTMRIYALLPDKSVAKGPTLTR